MKLVAEQLYALRKRKNELIDIMRRHSDYAKSQREKGLIEGICMPIYADPFDAEELKNSVVEYAKLQQVLCSSDIVKSRVFDQIDIGTAFYAHVNGEEKQRFVLVEKDVTNAKDYQFLSLDSDFGRAVFGKQGGETVVYQSDSSATPIQATIDEIDQLSSHYLHFLRKDKPVKAKQLVITESQRVLAGEELLNDKNLTVERKALLRKMILSPTVKAPSDGTIGIGSKVSVFLLDDEGEPHDFEFELIDKALTTELDCDYVERKSPFGRAVIGLQENDSFIVSGTKIKGIVMSVQNEEKQKERVI